MVRLTALAGACLATAQAYEFNSEVAFLERQESVLRSIRNDFNTLKTRTRRELEWSGQEHKEMPGWNQVSQKLAGDAGWLGHVAQSGDITEFGEPVGASGRSTSNGFGTGNGTDIGLLSLRKFRQLKSIILYLQQDPEFGKYCYYGCWCFIDGSDNLQTGYGPPRDQIDEACMAFSKCYRCLDMDYPTFKETQRYNFQYNEDNGVKSVSCLDAAGTMKRNLCECDVELAERLAEYESIWQEKWHAQRNPDFDRKKECFTPLNQKYEVDQCCGSYPARYPYSSRQGVKDCCGSKIYSNEFSQCCPDNSIKGVDETC